MSNFSSLQNKCLLFSASLVLPLMQFYEIYLLLHSQQFYGIYLLLHSQVLSHWLTFSNASRSPRELPLWNATTFTKEIDSKERLQPSTMQLTRNTLSIRITSRKPSRSVCLRRSCSTTIALREGTLTRKSYGPCRFNGGS